MLVFNTQCHTEFRQFIPQLKKSGQIQHIYLTEANNGSTGEPCDGNNLETLLLGDIKPHHMQTFQDAVHNCGGMAVLLYLHAMVSLSLFFFGLLMFIVIIFIIIIVIVIVISLTSVLHATLDWIGYINALSICSWSLISKLCMHLFSNLRFTLGCRI